MTAGGFAATVSMMRVSGREASGRKGLRLVSGSGGRVPGVVHALVERVERVHVGGVELEVEHGGVSDDALPGDRRGDHHEAVLRRPADQDLRRRHAGPASHGGDHRVVETPAAGERAVRLELDAALSADDNPF